MRTKADIELVSDSDDVRSFHVLFVNTASTAAPVGAIANKGCHHVRAIALVNQAIGETNAGIDVGAGC